MKPIILNRFPIDFQWQTQEPFLFCVHHKDYFPPGTSNFGPDPQFLQGRNLGQDFQLKDGFRMYHGETVPGFPVHPHRGFETVTLVRQGYIDHADSLGAAGRYGEGDVQWMTAGKGIQHSEMFPLLRSDQENPVELFQIWLNLPASRKMVSPDFKMLWNETIPVVELPQQNSRVTLIAGTYNQITPPSPPKASWAVDPSNETAIWIIQIGPHGEFEIPTSAQSVARSLYFYKGESLSLNQEAIPSKTGVFVDSLQRLILRTQEKAVEVVLLQAKPIQEPLAQHGPFVMNTSAEIKQAFQDYRKTQFGGWPWPQEDMVHGPQIERFAKYPDGHIEYPKNTAKLGKR